MSERTIVSAVSRGPGNRAGRLATRSAVSRTSSYLRWALLTDCTCSLAAGMFAFQLRFGQQDHLGGPYLSISLSLPLLWCATVALAAGYDSGFIRLGSDEFRRVLNAGVAILAYPTKTGPGRLCRHRAARRNVI